MIDSSCPSGERYTEAMKELFFLHWVGWGLMVGLLLLSVLGIYLQRDRRRAARKPRAA